MSAAPAVATQSNIIEGNIAGGVLKQITKLVEARTLFFPENYSVQNALRNAWFYIQNSENKEKILACTKESQANALYDMCLQRMDVSKGQGYFIPYGNRLMFQRSYFGDEALAKDVRPGIQIYYDVIYKGETLKLAKKLTAYGYVTIIESHEKPWPRTSTEIEGAYCGVIDENGEHMGDEIMTIDQIKQSWAKSKTYSANSKTFHNEQPDKACLRTVIRRRTKVIIATSNDAALLESVRRQDEDGFLGQLDEEEATNANSKVIELPQTASPSVNKETGEISEDPVTEQEEAPEQQQADYDIPSLQATLKLSDENLKVLSDGLDDLEAKGVMVPPLGAFLAFLIEKGAKTMKEMKEAVAALETPAEEAPAKNRGF
jgi:recombination protein RecT